MKRVTDDKYINIVILKVVKVLKVTKPEFNVNLTQIRKLKLLRRRSGAKNEYNNK